MGDMKERNTHTQRERGTKRYNSINKICNSYKNEQQPLQKVTNSLYIMTHLGQLPFMLITQMARTWALKEDGVNTSIIHWYSTLPRNGRIHRLSKNTGKKQKVLGQVGFVRVGWIRKQKTELVGSEELKSIVGEPMSVVRNHPTLCPASTGPIRRYTHLLPKRPEPVCRKTLGHSICDIIGRGYLL